MNSRPKRRLSLHHRLAAAFAILALVLSTVLAALTYDFCRRYLISHRESGATRQALIDAGLVASAQRDARSAGPALPEFGTATDTFGALLRVDGVWHGSSATTATTELPPSLVRLADDGKVARQRAAYGGATALFVAVPIPGSDDVYVEAFALTDLERTLHTIAMVVTFGAIATTLLGALLGIAASRLVMRPLRDVAEAAEGISAGDLDRRLRPTGDADLERLVAAFNEMVDALEERGDQEARFASDVSHELRTPLTAMRGALDLLDRRLGPEARDVFEVLRQQCTRFEKLVLDLLEISRFDTSDHELTLEHVDPRLVVEAAMRNSGHADVPVVIDASAPTDFVLDKRRIDRILANLLANADLHAGGARRVCISGTEDRLRIAVEDAGPGIPEQERAVIFERFHRGPNASGDTGTGLGLAIVAEHCGVHGGTVCAEPRRDGGARFVVEIPAHAV